jgi:hypothetical protein
MSLVSCLKNYLLMKMRYIFALILISCEIQHTQKKNMLHMKEKNWKKMLEKHDVCIQDDRVTQVGNVKATMI